MKKRRSKRKAVKFVGEVVISVIKALIIWGITQTIQDVLRTRPKSLALPAWLVVVAFFSPSLAVFLVVAVVGSYLAGQFYKQVWGQNL